MLQVQYIVKVNLIDPIAEIEKDQITGPLPVRYRRFIDELQLNKATSKLKTKKVNKSALNKSLISANGH